ncbi:hypothetical protein [Lignipirellula cremea]|uniref:Uncharacterized protein n=1 Tax=Lignipirellula cremea TaxID=2528010 RepID=A0A518E1J8_9BACT|nr:hypothetical protein [Lignipirellula cremea]QDU97941.1 hypothetical protein Pla8534_58000 [Lignipirellula cremea]
MSPSDLNRRQFNRLSAAAMGGLLAGGVLGCSSEPAKDPKTADATPAAGDAKGKHLCRGLNACKDQGATGKNACRGQGACATYEKHSCAGENACKGQGGCGENPGLNECKGKGGCDVPLMETAWDVVRKRLVAQWEKEKLAFGEAPAAPKADAPTTDEAADAPKTED